MLWVAVRESNLISRRRAMTSATPARYYESAMGLLATRGLPGVTIAALSRDTGVSSGSFYHHFGSWDGFVDRFAEQWEMDRTNGIAELTSIKNDPRRQLREFVRAANAIPHAAEIGIRAWANSDARVAAAQQRVDDLRLNFLREMIGDLVIDRQDARALASLALSTFVGLELLQRQITRRESTRVLATLQAFILSYSEPPR